MFESLRIVAATWTHRMPEQFHAVEALQSGNTFSRIIRDAGKWWAYSTPRSEGGYAMAYKFSDHYTGRHQTKP